MSVQGFPKSVKIVCAALLCSPCFAYFSRLFDGAKRWCFQLSVNFSPCIANGPCSGEQYRPKCRVLHRSPSPQAKLPGSHAGNSTGGGGLIRASPLSHTLQYSTTV